MLLLLLITRILVWTAETIFAIAQRCDSKMSIDGYRKRDPILPPPFIPEIGNNRSIIITNNCNEVIWPAIFTVNNTGPYTQGFVLQEHKSLEIWVSDDWNGRIWARTNCNFDEATDVGTCDTGSCGDVLNCSLSGSPPTTIAEFNLLGWKNSTFWDISLVNGFNLPMGIYASPDGPEAICQWSQSPQSIKQLCPSDLIFYADAKIAGCLSACDRYRLPEYCCTGSYDNPQTCIPRNYSEVFKRICPDAYSFAYDDNTSLFVTPLEPVSSFQVTFCPGFPISYGALTVVGPSTTHFQPSNSLNFGLSHGGSVYWHMELFFAILMWIGI
jgi:hypothetical protein